MGDAPVMAWTSPLTYSYLHFPLKVFFKCHMGFIEYCNHSILLNDDRYRVNYSLNHLDAFALFFYDNPM